MNEPSRDRHLSQALAHAPDRHAAPPEHVSAQILAAAHRASDEAVRLLPGRPAPWWRTPWGASGALATLLMAGFLGLLWRGESPGPAVDAPAPAAVQAPQAAPAAAPEVAVATADEAAPRAATMAKSTADAPARERVLRAREAVVESDSRVTEASRTAAPLAVPIKTTGSPQAAPATGASVAGSVSAPPSALASAAPVVAALTSHPAKLSQSARALAAASQLSLPTMQPGDVLSWLSPSLAATPDAAWMQQLASLTAGRWLAEERSPPEDGTALRIERGNSALGLLRLGSGTVWWCPTGQSCLLAQVPPAALSELIGKLPGAR